MYLWNLNSSADKMPGLLEAAEYFQIATLKKYCSRHLVRKLSVDNCLEMLDTAYKYNMKDLKRLSADLLVPNRQLLCWDAKFITFFYENLSSYCKVCINCNLSF
jgi:hypothetical protein